MEQTGEFQIAAARVAVWDGLNDPEVLARCIDGCRSFAKTSDVEFDAAVKAKVGPLRATFHARLLLSEVNRPHGYTLTAAVAGGPAGFAKGSAVVELTDVGSQTLLRYSVRGSVGGKLAQVGSRFVDAAARKIADDFFAAFAREMADAEECLMHGRAEGRE